MKTVKATEVITCESENDLPRIADKLINAYPDSRVFAFYGQMGAGKTTFIKVICRQLGAADIVQSPSFSLINEYKTGTGESLFHFDFYRIRKLDEIYDIGYEDYIFSGSYCFIEWPEMMEKLLPDDVVKVIISGDNSRVIEF